ncbi:hypothetical protein GWI33_007642 [Rhynchophorus ferrugineus]|uniref:Uncharacterized protein n=1 Tax=Rhynchophorus ferrugineus TaxID=354439 RepID=A0A834IFW3_RHYFE|nr:hypothetical protein GWI33_007642 [Rhynchophorus ferrugineus]
MSCWPWFERSVAPQPCMLNDMASVEQQSLAATAAAANEFKGIPKSKRKLQKHLRSAGLAYVSRTGKVIPAKRVAVEVPRSARDGQTNKPSTSKQTVRTVDGNLTFPSSGPTPRPPHSDATTTADDLTMFRVVVERNVAVPPLPFLLGGAPVVPGLVACRTVNSPSADRGRHQR